jgi:hypothetical protein
LRLVRIPALFLAAVIPCLAAVCLETGTTVEWKTSSVLPGETFIMQNDYGGSYTGVPPTGMPPAGGIGDILGDIIPGRRNPTRLPGPSTYPTPGRAAYSEARLQLQQIADQTGGRKYAPQAMDDLNRVYSEIADDLRIQYWLGCKSSNRSVDGSWRAIQVKVKNHPNAAVRTRKGYYAQSQQDLTRQPAVARP